MAMCTDSRASQLSRVQKLRLSDFDLTESLRSFSAWRGPPRIRRRTIRHLFQCFASRRVNLKPWSFVCIPMTAFFADLRYALRMMRKSPLVTVIAVASLTLGIGANCAMFSVADLLAFRPLPVKDSSKILEIYTGLESGGRARLSYPEFRDLKTEARTFSKIAVSTERTLTYADAGEVQEANHPSVLASASAVSADYFDVLGLRLAIGRAFNEAEDRVLNANPAVIISYDWWVRRHGKDAGILNRQVRINNRIFTVVGVAPEGFHGLDRYQWTDFYIPTAMQDAAYPSKAGVRPYEDRADRWLNVYARLADGATRDRANAEMKAIASRWGQVHPETNLRRVLRGLTEVEAREEDSPSTYAVSVGMLVMTGLVLLIGCANVANILMSRASGRRKEIAVRMAIGAGRGRLIRQLLTESAMLSVLGTLLGVAAAYWVVHLIHGIHLPTDLPVTIDVQVDQRALLFASIAGVLTTFLFGLAPALQLSRPDLVSALKSAIQTMPVGRFRVPLGSVLVTGQLGVSLLLLMISGLVLKGLDVMEHRQTGFRRDHSLLMSLDPRMNGYSADESRRLHERVLERVRQEPGVQGATLIYPVLTGPDGDMTKIWIPGFELPKDRDSIRVLSAYVEAGYFETMDTPLLAGRGFRETDDEAHPNVVVINQKMAATYWPGQDAVGKRIRIGGSKGDWAEVIGIAGNGIYRETLEPQSTFLFRAWRQNPAGVATMIVHTAGEPTSQALQLRGAIRQVDPALTVFDVRSLEQLYIGKSMLGPRFVTSILTVIGAIGLVLALTGLYGVIAYSVARRTREIGIRMSLGATGAGVRRMVLWQGLRYFLIGAPLGMALSFLFLKPLDLFLAGVSPYSLDTLLGIPVLLGLVAAAATLFPAQQAARVLPTQALRQE
jgi:predicted permease